MPSKYLLLYIFSVLVVSVAQVLLKSSANREHRNGLREYLNWRVALAYAMMLATTFMTIIAYRQVQLKDGPVWSSLGYVFVLVLGRLFLGERVTWSRVAGILLIIAGIYVFTLQ